MKTYRVNISEEEYADLGFILKYLSRSQDIALRRAYDLTKKLSKGITQQIIKQRLCEISEQLLSDSNIEKQTLLLEEYRKLEINLKE